MKTTNFKILFSILLYPLVFLFFGCSETLSKGKDDITIRLFNKNVNLNIQKKTNSNKILWIIIHSNENTAIDVGKYCLSKYGGTLMIFENSNERNIAFDFKDKEYKIDPNRTFTKKGIKESLLKLNNNCSNSEIEILTDSIYFQFEPLRTFLKGYNKIIALHNNTNNNYSIVTYSENGDENKCDSFYINKALDADNFIITNLSKSFNYFKSQKINTVFQNSVYYDDGSMIIWAIINKKTYYNVESEFNATEYQKSLITKIID
jgi:hypothetical protein